MRPEPAEGEWTASGADYRARISAGLSSSAWLRDVLLKPAVKRLLGDRSSDRVLDVGTGGGWLFDEVPVAEAFACDIAPAGQSRQDVRFDLADVTSLPYGDGRFDAVVASVVLCYCPDLAAAARELARVTAVGGSAVVAMVHPYFYRTGEVGDDGSFRVTADLSGAGPFPIMIGGRVGPFTYYPHRPDEYVTAFLAAGWSLRAMEDSFIPWREYGSIFPPNGDEIRRSPKVPLFTFLRFDR